MSTVLRLNGQGKAPMVHQPTLPADDQLDTRIAVIQALIPLGLQAVEEVLQQEVAALAGPRYARGDGAPRSEPSGGGRDTPAELHAAPSAAGGG